MLVASIAAAVWFGALNTSIGVGGWRRVERGLSGGLRLEGYPASGSNGS